MPAVPHIAGMFRKRPPPTLKQVQEARDALAATLSEGWSGEGSPTEPDVLQVLPMRVRFALLSEDVVSGGPADPGSPVVSECAAGEGDEFAGVRESFSAEPSYRRVVLGKPGAGKTVLITELAVQLLEAHRGGGSTACDIAYCGLESRKRITAGVAYQAACDELRLALVAGPSTYGGKSRDAGPRRAGRNARTFARGRSGPDQRVPHQPATGGDRPEPEEYLRRPARH